MYTLLGPPPPGQIVEWDQGFGPGLFVGGSQGWTKYNLAYDNGGQLQTAAVSRDGSPADSFTYDYDAASNRLTEQTVTTTTAGTTTTTINFSYSALNVVVPASMFGNVSKRSYRHY